MALKTNKVISKSKVSGFTIVELLVVIVIIGILAAITIVSYTGITAKANEAALKSDLANNSKKLNMYNAQYGEYPHINSVSGCPEAPSTVDNNYCLKFSSGNAFSYTYKTTTTYGLSATRGTTTYSVTESSAPQTALTNCPAGFVLVPGSATYGTSNFCVMKYEAKADDNGDGVGDTNQTTGYNTWPANTYPISASRKLVSTPGGYPVALISQTDATVAAQNFTKDCMGCHLISEAEWMTIAQNVLGVGNNWSSGTVGGGFIYSGHNDSVPNNVLIDSSNGTDGYNGTGQTTGSNQRRTLALSNGSVVWDLAGNIYEWSSGQVSSAIQPGVVGNTYTSLLEYPAVTTPGSLPVSIAPASTGISGAGSWNSSNGIGQLLSNPADLSSRGFLRGGYWYHASSAGVLSLYLTLSPSYGNYDIGFRVAAPAF